MVVDGCLDIITRKQNIITLNGNYCNNSPTQSYSPHLQLPPSSQHWTEFQFVYYGNLLSFYHSTAAATTKSLNQTHSWRVPWSLDTQRRRLSRKKWGRRRCYNASRESNSTIIIPCFVVIIAERKTRPSLC